jgi:hypothetical protein
MKRIIKQNRLAYRQPGLDRICGLQAARQSGESLLPRIAIIIWLLFLRPIIFFASCRL